MKFLCVPCDRPMTLERTAPPDRGSMALVYSCPDCGYEFAMLTNAAETQMVGSLGVQVGQGAAAGESRCPFTGVVRELTAEAATAGVRWSAAAEARMARVPELVLPLVRAGIERYAAEHGYTEIDERVLDEARATLGV